MGKNDQASSAWVPASLPSASIRFCSEYIPLGSSHRTFLCVFVLTPSPNTPSKLGLPFLASVLKQRRGPLASVLWPEQLGKCYSRTLGFGVVFVPNTLSLRPLSQQLWMYAALVKRFSNILRFFVYPGIGTGVPVPDLPLRLQNILSRVV